MNLKRQEGQVEVIISLVLASVIIYLAIIFGLYDQRSGYLGFVIGIVLFTFYFILAVGILIWLAMQFKEYNDYGEKSFGGWLAIIIVSIFYVLWLWAGLSTAKESQFIWVLVLPLIVWLVRKYLDHRALKRELEAENTGSEHEASTFEVDNRNPTAKPALEDRVLALVRHFEPNWRHKNGKLRLEGGENGNNANLADYLRKNGLDVETEETLSNGSRADVIINREIVLECKPQLKSTDTLHKIAGEVKRDRKSAGYKVYAVIYGDARGDLYEELMDDIGGSSVILLGELIED